MSEAIKLLTSNIEKVIVGKKESIMQAVAALLMNGHALVEDVPGVGKTQLAAALSRSVNGTFNRVQMTPDIMPSDITGFSMINGRSDQFEFRKGAAFCNFLLADEINRASPKAQSALLEAMEERQISIDGKTYPLPEPFMVIATQNPVETYGTYHLPEAQMDRFAMRIYLGYPSAEDESAILDRNEFQNPINSIKPVLSTEDIINLREDIKKVKCTEKIKNYIISIVNATRSNDSISLGISPRGSISLFKASKVYAFMDGRDFVIPEDIKACAECVLSHRIILSPKGKSVFGTQDNVVSDLISKTSVPKM